MDTPIIDRPREKDSEIAHIVEGEITHRSFKSIKGTIYATFKLDQDGVWYVFCQLSFPVYHDGAAYKSCIITIRTEFYGDADNFGRWLSFAS